MFSARIHLNNVLHAGRQQRWWGWKHGDSGGADPNQMKYSK
jgi:hypothetical protein